MSENSPVSPKHYKSEASSIQLCQAIERICEGHEADEVANLSPILKYLGRYGKKDPAKSVEDLEKAVWYFSRLLGLLRWKHSGEDYPDPDGDMVMVTREYITALEFCAQESTVKEGESVVFAVDLPKGTYIDIEDYNTHQILADGKPVRWRVV